MKYLEIFLFGSILAFSVPAAGQEADDYDMGITQMLLLKDAADWEPGEPGRASGIRAKQRDALEQLILDGKAALAGEFPGNGPLRQVLVFNTESADEARTTAGELPAVREGMFEIEQLTWYTARNYLRKPALPLERTRYYFGILVRGENAGSFQPEELERIQEGHMANIKRLAELGKLVVAGPFSNGGDRRGIFIFKTDTMEEAQALTGTDPAVQAGRLAIELYPLETFRRMLP